MGVPRSQYSTSENSSQGTTLNMTNAKPVRIVGRQQSFRPTIAKWNGFHLGSTFDIAPHEIAKKIVKIVWASFIVDSDHTSPLAGFSLQKRTVSFAWMPSYTLSRIV